VLEPRSHRRHNVRCFCGPQAFSGPVRAADGHGSSPHAAAAPWRAAPRQRLVQVAVPHCAAPRFAALCCPDARDGLILPLLLLLLLLPPPPSSRLRMGHCTWRALPRSALTRRAVLLVAFSTPSGC
jgi:hypothetical protein